MRFLPSPKLSQRRGIYFLEPHRKYISCKKEDDESVWYGNGYFCKLPFSFISSPNDIWNSYRENKSKPCHQSYVHSRKVRNCFDKTSKGYDHQECCYKFCYQKFPHSFPHFFHFLIWYLFITMMDFYPKFSKKWAVLNSLTDKSYNCNCQYCQPIKCYNKKIRKINSSIIT